jgi:2-polyprenyl-6-methoxyphenol hydroxylase-like FAD-dependent oxidoreductase
MERFQPTGTAGGAGHHTAEVVVVGARCAGAATARLLAERGHDVLIVDRAEFPSDTLSTHAIARTGVVQLHRWGLLDRVLASGAPPIREVVFHTAGQRIERTIREHGGVDMLVAPRRHELDAILLDAAIEAGARVWTGVTVDGVQRADDGRVTGIYGRNGDDPVGISARYVVGADGLRSRIARAVAAPVTEARSAGGAAHYAYYRGDWQAMEYYVGDGAFAGVFPTHRGEANIWVCNNADVAERYRRWHDTLDDAFSAMLRQAAPELYARIDPYQRSSVTRGQMRLPNQYRQPYGPGWALVGDAGYHRDPITGQGISDAFRDAELLACSLDAILSEDVDEMVALDAYRDSRDAMSREIFELTDKLAQFPPAAQFIELQKALGQAIEAQSTTLANQSGCLVGASA